MSHSTTNKKQTKPFHKTRSEELSGFISSGVREALSHFKNANISVDYKTLEERWSFLLLMGQGENKSVLAETCSTLLSTPVESLEEAEYLMVQCKTSFQSIMCSLSLLQSYVLNHCSNFLILLDRWIFIAGSFRCSTTKFLNAITHNFISITWPAAQTLPHHTIHSLARAQDKEAGWETSLCLLCMEEISSTKTLSQSSTAVWAQLCWQTFQFKTWAKVRLYDKVKPLQLVLTFDLPRAKI